MFALLCIWFLISFPLVWVGVWLGYRRELKDPPVKTNMVPRVIPSQARATANPRAPARHARARTRARARPGARVGPRPHPSSNPGPDRTPHLTPHLTPHRTPHRIPPLTPPNPNQAWYLNLLFTMLIGGILPFGAVFIELYFIMSSVWLQT
jgi:hypothetical protein